MLWNEVHNIIHDGHNWRGERNHHLKLVSTLGGMGRSCLALTLCKGKGWLKSTAPTSHSYLIVVGRDPLDCLSFKGTIIISDIAVPLEMFLTLCLINEKQLTTLMTNQLIKLFLFFLAFFFSIIVYLVYHYASHMVTQKVIITRKCCQRTKIALSNNLLWFIGSVYYIGVD